MEVEARHGSVAGRVGYTDEADGAPAAGWAVAVKGAYYPQHSLLPLGAAFAYVRP